MFLTFTGFIERVPRVRLAARNNAKAADLDVARGMQGMGRTRVLLVEDDILIAWTISSVLKQLGCTVVDYADNADEAVERALAVRPDVILMDIGLAGARDGIAAAEEIRAYTGQSVIYLTGHTDIATLERAAQTEPLSFVFKPFDESTLGAALDCALARQPAG
jgi:two-component system cell cycle sensor histidine kinase/response regulator CckA